MDNYARATVQTNARSFDDRNTGSSPIPAPVMGVHDSLSEQRGQIERLHQLTSQLEERLGTVLRQEPANPAFSGSAGKEEIQVVAKIQEHTRMLRVLSVRLESIFDRIEL
jgi:hypothetical protein